ncbi:GrpB family protein [Shouchella miscanthi]|uniref:GrpB family protein n=1 Tax=Shouchella miscanthi TaxID=2598861 RepID=A0ABU6NM92_9BACI|nr:GrpB family protein [Shouchella miscanthi]
MFGLEQNRVSLSLHNELWKEGFQKEKQRLSTILYAFTPTIEHIGSTAIPGLKAKPILDICIGIDTLSLFHQFPFETLQNDHFHRLKNVQLDDRFVLAKFTDQTYTNKSIVLHIVERDSTTCSTLLLFRDYLRNNQDVALLYEQLKLSLAKQFPTDPKAYTDGKKAFVQTILKKAGDHR